MANQYDTNLKLQAIADAIGDTQSSGLISALEDIADAVAGGGGGGSAAAGLVSDNFSETDTYDLGDYCIHNNTLYVCINAITTPGPWDISDWQATNAGRQLSSLNSALRNIKFYPITVNVTFPNRIYSNQININTITEGVVSGSNVKSVIACGVGVSMFPVLDSSKNGLYIYSTEARNMSADCLIVFLYT